MSLADRPDIWDPVLVRMYNKTVWQVVSADNVTHEIAEFAQWYQANNYVKAHPKERLLILEHRVSKTRVNGRLV